VSLAACGVGDRVADLGPGRRTARSLEGAREQRLVPGLLAMAARWIPWRMISASLMPRRSAASLMIARPSGSAWTFVRFVGTYRPWYSGGFSPP
jgi:hypothetical protein